ncbi:MAG: NAD(P)H-binding protein [Saccharothrix sp.]|nr:NAD(P)H-binding protein [Saccharothrix sp.]
MTVLVTGATGTVGRHLVRLLTGPVRAVSREPGAHTGADHVTHVDDDPVHLAGVTALFVHPRAVADAAALVDRARAAGVAKVVALSALNVDDDPADQPSRLRGDRNKEAEDAVAGSGLPWVSVRAGSFAGNTATAWAHQIRTGDVVRGPHADFAEAPLDERDLAEVLAHALTTDTLDGRRVELTGPASHTHREMVAIIGDALGRPLRHQEIPPDQAGEHLIRAGLPPAFVHALMARYARGAGLPATVTDEVHRILGRPARTLARWAADHTHLFTGAPRP